jgi:hypothetical protein
MISRTSDNQSWPDGVAIELPIVKERTMTFKQAVKLLPSCVPSYDPLTHKTVEDLRFLAQFELDLHDEGDQELSHTDYNAIRRFLQRTA